jgi:hypothetical protein
MEDIVGLSVDGFVHDKIRDLRLDGTIYRLIAKTVH